VPVLENRHTGSTSAAWQAETAAIDRQSAYSDSEHIAEIARFTVHATLFSLVNGQWIYNEYTYTAQ
jgi:hypothetical protein